jgi:hypothetical protein
MATKTKVSVKARTKKSSVKARAKALHHKDVVEVCATSRSVTMTSRGRGAPWTIAGNGSSTAAATATLSASDFTRHLFCTKLGITGVPPAATITSISVRLFKLSDEAMARAYVSDRSLRIVVNGVARKISEDADTTNMWPPVPISKTYSRINCWNLKLKGTQVTKPNFGFVISADYMADDGADDCMIQVSRVKVTVCWETT